MTEPHKAIGLFSGGLDSLLAAAIMRREGFEVTLLHFYTGFNGKLARELAGGPGWVWTPTDSVAATAEKIGAKLIPQDISEEYLSVFIGPKFGRGSGVNPCIDCHIVFLVKARELMERESAAFVFTGEVLGQRPMSQHRPTLRLIERESGLEGMLLRPLSAKLLDPTVPEEKGIVVRNHLYDLSGRTRKPQEKLALEFGFDSFPQPGGGCLLTDKAFRAKYYDFVRYANGAAITRKDLTAMKTGRHLRLRSGVKVISGRNETENEYLHTLLDGECWMFDAEEHEGSLVFAFGELSADDMRFTASVCARYGKGCGQEMVKVAARKGEQVAQFLVKPASLEEIDPLRVG